MSSASVERRASGSGSDRDDVSADADMCGNLRWRRATANHTPSRDTLSEIGDLAELEDPPAAADRDTPDRYVASDTGNASATGPSPRTAEPMAGATHTIGVSPAPADGRSWRSRATTSIGGTSLNRGTRYLLERPVQQLPVGELERLEQRAAETLHRRDPTTWLRRPSGLTIAPHSKAMTRRSTLKPAPSRDTSAAVAT